MSVSDVPSGLKTLEPRGPETDPHHSKRRARAMFEPAIVRRAILDSFVKLDPRLQAKNPVMFIVEVGSVLTTFLFFRDLGRVGAATNWFAGLVAAFLWFTVLFANFAEAMAEGRGKAQAETLRKTRAETVAYVRQADGDLVETPSSKLQVGDLCVVRPGQLIPGDGDVVEGIASVDESAITGESAPVIRESGGDRCAVTGGTRVLSDEIVVKITSKPGETFLDRMIALVEGAERQKTPNEIALNILLAGLTIIFMLAVVTLQPFAIYSQRAAVDHRARRAARVPHPDHDRRAAVGDRHRGHGPARAAQRAGDERPRGRGGRRLLDAAARQDRHDHDRQPRSRRVPARCPASTSATLAEAAQLSSLADETPEGRSIVVLAKDRFGLRERELGDAQLVPFTAQTRMSGIDIAGRVVRKGAADAVQRWVVEEGGVVPDDARADRRAHRPRPAARRSSWPRTAASSASSTSRTSSSRASRPASRSCGAWASAP